MDTKRHSAHARFYRPLIFTLVITACHPTTGSKEATPEEIATFFKESHKKVLTFVGYSGAEYEDKAAMLTQAKRILAEFDPAKTIVNIGATLDGIGAVYEEAKRLGFVTTGTVSTQARESKAALSPYVDHVFYVKDATWGGLLESTRQLSPTSTAMVMSSDVMVGIGGGDVARDEMLAAKQLGKEVRFIPADMNHRIAIEKAEKKGQSSPTEFHGAAHAVFSATDNQTRNSTEETPHHDSQANGRARGRADAGRPSGRITALGSRVSFRHCTTGVE